MTVDEVFSLMKYIINVNQNGGLTRSGFHSVINQGQRSYQAWLLGLPQEYLPGRPVARVELGQNSIVRQRLSPTINNATLTIDGSGNADYPDDYIQTDSLRTTAGKRITYTDQSVRDSKVNSVIDPVATNPIYLLQQTDFQFYPVTLGSAILSYVGQVPDIAWGFTLDGNGREIYSAGTSVQPVWDDVAMFDIIVRALAMVGINLQVGAVIQFSNQVKQVGQ